jgi:hypothetical protein
MRSGEELRALHERYVHKVNVAVEDGDDRTVDALAEEYADEALDLIVSG